MGLDLSYSIRLVTQIEKLIDSYYLSNKHSSYELAGVLKGDVPYYYKLEIDYTDHPIFKDLEEIDSDTFLDFYRHNLVIK